MFCTNCGAKNDEKARFCEKCGTSLTETKNTQDSVVNEHVSSEATIESSEPEVQAFEQESSVSPVESSPVITEEVKPETEFVLTPVKKNKKLPIIAAVLAVIILGALFWDSVFAAVAPKLYTQSVIMDTLEKIADEMMTAEKNILGFNVEEEKELTYSVEGILNEVNDVDLNGIGFKVTAKNSEKKKKLMYSAEAVYDGETLASGLFMLDDKNIYIDSPEFFKDSLSIPAKGFGKAWNDSDLADETEIEFSEDLDLNYSELFEKKDFLTKKSNKSIEKEIKNLIEASTLEKSKGTAEVGGKNVNTKTLIISIDPDDIEDTFCNILDIVEEDENVKEFFEMNEEAKDAKDEFFDGLKDVAKELSGIFDEEIVVELQVYKGKAVLIAAELDFDGDPSVRIETAFEDKNTLINDMRMLIEVKAQGQKAVIEINSEGNHIAKGKVFTDETVVEIKSPYGEKIEFEHTLTLDMKQNNYEQDFKIKGDGENVGISLEGTCSNKKGFKLELDSIKFKGVDTEELTKIKGKLTMTITPEAKFDKVNTSGSLNILAADEDDLEKWGEDVAEKAEKFAEKNEELFSSEVAEVFGLGGNSYEDYYYEDDYYEYDYDEYDFDEYDFYE